MLKRRFGGEGWLSPEEEEAWRRRGGLEEKAGSVLACLLAKFRGSLESGARQVSCLAF